MHNTFRIRFGVSVSDNRKSKIENRKLAGIVALVVTLAMCGAVAQAQQAKKVPRIGYLTVASLSSNVARVEAFRQGLRELGYVEGKNIVIEWRSGEGKVERQGELAAEVVRLKVDVIVTSGTTMTRAAKEATAAIPIVMAQDTDPVGNGFVASLARPGGNITGLSVLSPELSGKQLELLKEIVPKLSRVAVLGNSNEPANPKTLKEIELAARSFGVQLQPLDVLGPKDIETAFRAATKAHADALLVLPSAILTDHRTGVVNLALKSRLPAIYMSSIWVDNGGLMSYGTSLTDLSRRAATYVDKILTGTKPADLPVEQPTKFEFVINLKAAKQIGLTIPPNVLARADRVIK
jgi:putative tryptophan/tyrosine transport system substrate-binding protein